MIGARLGPYQIQRELGTGGMGTVYCAAGPEGLVAIKVVHPHLLQTEGFFKRFLREATIGRDLRHPNVVRTLDCDAVGGHHFLVMEYVEGQTLSALRDELEQLPEELCRHVGREICRGLVAIHAAGVVHRDLKPDNVLITADHRVKVMDLGVAKLVEEQLRLSRTGAFVGSLEYAAPEQFDDRPVDHRCDLHGLGVLLYEIASGTHPYRADDFRGVLRAICGQAPRRLGEVQPQLSPFFEEVVHTLLAKSPEARFPSAQAVLDVLEEGESGTWWRQRARSLRAITRRPLRRIRIARETAVYGREEQLDALRRLFDRADAGEGQVALVQGEAGIGKSRLIDEFVARLTSDGQELNFLFGGYPPGGAATAAGAFSTAFREHLGEEGSGEYLSETPSLGPAFDALLRGESPPSGAVSLNRESLQTCFVHVTRALAAERTTVVLIDDLHFAPAEGRALFMALALATRSSRVLLIGTARPDVPADWLAALTRLEHATPLTLPRLGPRDLVALLGDSFRSEELAGALSAQIATKSDGNPFFAFEIIRGLREGQFITQRNDGSWVSSKVIDAIRIPSSVLDLVRARVADLDEAQRDLLDVAACCGYEFDPLLLGDVLGLARIPLLKALGQIERRHRLIRARGLRYVFDHHQVQEALYESLSELLRRSYHGALGEALEHRSARDGGPDGATAVQLCEHFFAADLGRRALPHLAAARDHLGTAYLYQGARALVARALAVQGLLSAPERTRLLMSLVTRELPFVGTGAERIDIAREAVRLAEAAGDESLLAEARFTLGDVLLQMEPDDAEAELDAVGLFAKQRGDEGLLARVDALLGVLDATRGQNERAHERLVRAGAIHRRLGDLAAEARVELALATLHERTASPDEAIANCRRAEELGERAGDREVQLRAAAVLTFVLFSLGRLAEAKDLGERQLALCREHGLRNGQTNSHTVLGNVACLRGDAARAERHYLRCRELARETGHAPAEVASLTNLGLVASLEHRLVDALDWFERGLERSREFGYARSEAVALVNLADAHRRLGDPERATVVAEDARALAETSGLSYPQGYALHVLGEIAHDRNDLPSARDAFERALALRRTIGHRDGIADSLIELADLDLREGHVAAARGRLDEALELTQQQERSPKSALAAALAARLPDASPGTIEAALAHADAGPASPRVRFALWSATGDDEQLAEAVRLVDDALTRVPEERRAAIVESERVHREILRAARAHLGHL